MSTFFNKDKSSIFFNAFTNILQFFLHFMSTFWLTRFFINTLTLGVYGMFPLARNTIEIISIVTSIITIPAGRNLLVSHSRGEIENSNMIFNSFLFGLAIVTIILLPVFILLSFFSPSFLKAPSGFETQVIFLFLSVAFSFILMSLSIPFSTCSFVKNRLDIKNIGEFLETISFIIISVIGISVFKLQLNAISLALIFKSVIRLTYSVIIWKILIPELVINRSYIDWNSLKDFLFMGGWLLLGTFGYVLFNSTDLLIINRYYGPELTGKYGAILALPQALSVLSGSISSVFNPPLLSCFGKNGLDKTIDSALQYVRILSMIIALPVGLIAGFSKPLLKFWLGDDFIPLTPIVIILVSPLLLNLSMTPLMTLRVIVKQLKLPAIFYTLTGVLKIGLVLILASPVFGLGLFGISIGYLLFLLINFAIFSPIYASKITNKSRFFFFPSFILPVVCFIITFFPSYFISQYYLADNIFSLILQITLVSLFYFIITTLFFINKSEKNLAIQKLEKPFNYILLLKTKFYDFFSIQYK